MNTQLILHVSAPLALELFQPQPNIRYSLEAAAHIAGTSRRSMLVYCRAGLVQPVLQPPHGVMTFTEEAIHTVRRLEQLRTVHRVNPGLIETMLALLDEVDHLRTELRFWRDSN